MKHKIPHARVVTSDGPVLGVVRQLWSDATESVVECLEAAAKAKIVREPEAQIRVTTHQDTPIVPWPRRRPTFDLSSTDAVHVLQAAAKRHGVGWSIFRAWRSEAGRELVFSLECDECDRGWRRTIPDQLLEASMHPVAVMMEQLLTTRCPHCAKARRSIPDLVILGED